jgi:hypothetical protein
MTASHLRKSWLSLAGLLSLALGNPAQASLAISNKPTNNVSCSAGVCTATAKSAVMNVGDLTSMLASSDVALVSGSMARDIDVKSAFSWASASRLSLDAYRSITFERSVTVAGSGALTLTTNDGGTDGNLSFTTTGRVHFWDLSSSLVIDGASYALVADVATLASDIAANPSGRYALAKNYDASVDGTYGRAPVQTALAGSVEGLGNSIGNLNIYGKGRKIVVGLFASIAASGSVNNLGLVAFYGHYGKQHVTGGLVSTNAGTLEGDFVSGTIQENDISADTGLLAGINLGTIRHCQSAGEIRQPNTSGSALGGLVGYNEALIDRSSSSVSIQADGAYFIGGLVGRSSGGTILNSSASGALPNLPGGPTVGGLLGATCCGKASSILGSYASGAVAGWLAGGLVGELGQAGDSIVDSHASGNVTAGQTGGGLVGSQALGTTITGSHADGNVSGFPYHIVQLLGGLVGFGQGAMATSYASGNVVLDPGATGGYGGGLVGRNNGGIDRSFAAGAVTGANTTNIQYEGGLVGLSALQATIANSYATGSVNGVGSDSNVGGLTGGSSDHSSIGASYEIGAVSGGVTGGFLGDNSADPGDNTNDYWDTVTSGASQGVGQGNADGVTGLTSTELQSGLPAGFDPSIWAESSDINGGFPYLIDNPPPL